MQELGEAVAQGLGWVPALAGLVMGLLGVLVLLGGAALLVYVMLCIASTRMRRASDVPKLLPTLVETVLDEDLRRAYRRSVRLDELLLGAGGTGRGQGSELGRALRKWIVCVQAERFAPGANDLLRSANGQSLHFVQIEHVLDEAFAHGEFEALDEGQRARRDQELCGLARRVDEARRAMR